MKRILLNILAPFAGLLVGSAVNMGIVEVGHMVLPAEGFNSQDFEAMKKAMENMGPAHFLFPFLAHALGTLVGAFVAAKVARSHKLIFAMLIGVLFLAGGAYMVALLPSPLWFNVLDLVVAYLPMAWIGWKLAISF